jgi:hypothetical protein
MRRTSAHANQTIETMPPPLTLFEKIWNRHVVRGFGDGRALIHVDRYAPRETTCWRAFDSLRERGLSGELRERGMIPHRALDCPRNDVIAEGVC